MLRARARLCKKTRANEARRNKRKQRSEDNEEKPTENGKAQKGRVTGSRSCLRKALVRPVLSARQEDSKLL